MSTFTQPDSVGVNDLPLTTQITEEIAPGFILNDVECGNIDVMGVVMGNITASGTVSLKAPARVMGNIVSAVLAVEPGVMFNGNCQMVKKEGHESKEAAK